MWIFLGIVGIITTHRFGALIRKTELVYLSLKKIVPRLITSSVTAGTIIYAFVFAASYFLNTLKKEELTFGRPLVGVINLTSGLIFLGLFFISPFIILKVIRKKKLKHLFGKPL